jgi:hypothetical protein
VSNVLSEEKKQQVIALGRSGWSLRRIQKAVGVRRETASGYLIKRRGIAIRLPGGWGWLAQTKPAIGVTTDVGAETGAISTATAEPKPGRCPSASACVPYGEAIELGLARGRNAMAIW